MLKLTQRDIGSSRGRLDVKLHMTSVSNFFCSAPGGAFHRHSDAAGACCREGGADIWGGAGRGTMLQGGAEAGGGCGATLQKGPRATGSGCRGKPYTVGEDGGEAAMLLWGSIGGGGAMLYGDGGGGGAML